MFLSATSVFAQARFKGGKGSGYDSDKFETIVSALEYEDNELSKGITLFPNPVRRGQTFTLKISRFKDINSILLIDVQGRIVRNLYKTSKNINLLSSTFTIKNEFSEGIYFVVLDYSSSRLYKKVVFI